MKANIKFLSGIDYQGSLEILLGNVYKGDKGKSAYESAVDAGFKGTEEEFNAVLSDSVCLGSEAPTSVPTVDKTTSDYSQQSLQDWDGNDLRKATYMTGVLDYEEFSTSKAYAVGDVVSYNNKLYKFIVPHSAGAFDEGQVEETSLRKETNRDIGKTIGLYNVTNQIYIDAIKFIAFVPKEEYKNNTFSIYALSARQNTQTDDKSITYLDLWILNEEESANQGKEINAAKASISPDSGTDITTPTCISVDGNAGRLYVIIDWNPIINYRNSEGKYSCVIWGANFVNPQSSNLVHIEKVKDNDSRIVNWDEAIKKSSVSNDYGVSDTNVASQMMASSIIGLSNGLSFNFSDRYSEELKVMRIIRKIYFSFLIEDKRDMSICKLAINGGYFQFGVSYLDGSSSLSSEVSINKIEEGSIPTGIMSFYQEIPWFGKMYVEIDFDEFKKLGNVVYNYAEPCCKINNIFDKNDHIWEVISSNSKTSPTQFTDFTKLNFGVDGDSITAGDQWSYYVTKILGFSNHHNVAVGSAKWSCRKQNLGDVTYQTQEYDDPEFAGISSGYEETSDPIEIQKRCNNCAKVHVQKFIDEVAKGQYPAPDIFAFAMGTNDGDMTPAESAINTGTEYPTGDMLFTLAGAMKWCIQKIHETYPNCKIFILLPIQRYNGGNSYNLQKIEIMKDIAKAFSVPIIDMYSNCGISSMLENGTGPYLRDGLHPNTEGQKLMGSYAATQIRNNYLVIE